MAAAGATTTSPASIADKPAAGQVVEHNGNTYTTVQEGLAYILIPPDTPVLTDPKAAKDGTIQSQSVFYNPIQQYNRDLTVLAIRAFGEEYVESKRAALQKKRAKKQQKQDQRKNTGGKRGLSDQRHAEPATKKRRLEDLKEATAGQESAEPSGKRDLLDDENIEPQLKRRRLEDSTQTAGAVNDRRPNGNAAVPGHHEQDGIEGDDIADEDLIACESSMAQAATQDSLSNNTNGQTPLADASGSQNEPKVKFEILDALSATGLRALRYAQEVPFVTSVTANDLSSKAVRSIKLNIEHNKLEGKVNTNIGNANAHMYMSVTQDGHGGAGHRYAVIDLDPYGTAVPFLDAAVQAVADGGLLCVTCTDTGVFNSVGFLEKTFALYGGLPIKGAHSHEGGLRLILHAITAAAAKYGIAVEPLLSLSIDYYARVFVRIRRSPNEVKLLAGKTMLVYGCDSGCGAWTTQPLARHSKQVGKGNNMFYKYSSGQGPTASPHCDHCGLKTHVSTLLHGMAPKLTGTRLPDRCMAGHCIIRHSLSGC
jgi:tRNA (guanine26-N2/guanine27-N2)-dimethyltransferase